MSLEHTLKLLNFHPRIFDRDVIGSAATLWAVPALNGGVPEDRFVRPGSGFWSHLTVSYQKSPSRI
jgi:hypothetical protein